MKGVKLLLCIICVFLTIVAAAAAIVIFKKEIACFLADMKEKFLKKDSCCSGDYADYAD